VNDERASKALAAWQALVRIARNPHQDAAGLKILEDLREARAYYKGMDRLSADQQRTFDRIEHQLSDERDT
jgi:hypothetical protein